jgi:hypothetical protein
MGALVAAELELATALGIAAIALREFVDPACGVDEALLSGEEGVAACADTYTDGLAGGQGVINRAAGAGDGGLMDLRMDFCFHGWMGINHGSSAR